MTCTDGPRPRPHCAAAKLKDLVEEGLRLVLQAPSKNRRRSSLAGLMKRGRGVIDSGIPDLGSNPEHLKGFGRDVRHR
ncbi:MAG: hypothetical protein ACJ8D7_12255 [Xanthobacteraceae bacterium]